MIIVLVDTNAIVSVLDMLKHKLIGTYVLVSANRHT